MPRFAVTLGIVFLAGLWLAACGAPSPSSPAPPPIAVGPLDTAEAYLQRGDQYAERAGYGDATAEHSQAIQLKLDYAEAYNNRAWPAL